MGEVATQEQGQQSLVPKLAPKDAVVSGSKPAALNPRNLPEAMQLADMIARSGMVPKAYQEKDGTVFPGKVLVGIMAGAEIGLAPFQALQSIAVIGNNPAIWGDGALALVLGSGLLVDMHEEDDGETATCTMIRKGRETAIIRSFSVEDAKKAGLAGKDGPWKNYPKRMRQMRARLFAIRDGFADVLKGLAIAEEVQDYVEVEARPASPSVKIGDLKRQAGREEPAADQSLATDAEFLSGDGTGTALPEASNEERESEGLAVSAEPEQGRTDEQHGDQHDGGDFAGTVEDELSPAEKRTLTLIDACARASKAEHITYVTDQVAKHEAALELDQIGRIEAAVKDAKKRLKL